MLKRPTKSLKTLYEWAVMNHVALPSFETVLEQHEELRSRLVMHFRTEPYRSRWMGASGTVIMEDIWNTDTLHHGVPDVMYLFAHMSLKIHNEAVCEGMGSIVDRHANSQRGLPMLMYVMKAFIHWNGPATQECEGFLKASLNGRGSFLSLLRVNLLLPHKKPKMSNMK